MGRSASGEIKTLLKFMAIVPRVSGRDGQGTCVSTTILVRSYSVDTTAREK